jgi:DNA-directed RNA polymerase subunit H (RpoH/RPB5)
MISPLWLRTVDPEELPKLLKDYPVTKDELVEILKARKVTKAELVQIVREWPDE